MSTSERQKRIQELISWAKPNLSDMISPPERWEFGDNEFAPSNYAEDREDRFIRIVQFEAQKRYGVSLQTAKDYARMVLFHYASQIQQIAARKWSQSRER